MAVPKAPGIQSGRIDADTTPAAPAVSASGPLRTSLAIAATFLGSLLLFSLEPYVGKLLLPAFGGTPLLWNSCMVFFQVALLVGYGLAMLLVRTLSSGRQVAVQLLLLCTLFFLYPSADGIVELPDAGPSTSLLVSLIRHVLVTFVALAALTTLVQAWLVGSTPHRSSNPYRLYAASNAGSMVGLFAYPLLFEPQLSLSGQRTAFLMLLTLVIIAVAALGATRPRSAAVSVTHHGAAKDGTGFPAAAWCRVIALAAIPSSLLLGVTGYILTDVASLPLFWVGPLALYLLTFIIAFGGRRGQHWRWLERGFSLSVLFIVVALSAEANSPASVLIPAHLLVFFVASLLCHQRVAAAAPDPQYLPQFYLAVSLGGAIGGIITLLVPPFVTDAMREYPLALVLSSTVLVATDTRARRWRGRALDVALPGVLLVGSVLLFRRCAPPELARFLPLAFAPAALFVLGANERGPVFALRFISFFVASTFLPSAFGQTMFAERSFFGRVRVTRDAATMANVLIHGSTVHGVQRLSAMTGCEPTTYYHPTGPAGRFLLALPPAASPRRVALVGLGSGALACYARDGERWDLFELDPVVARVASDSSYFTFLTHSRATRGPIILGDARLALARVNDVRYDVIIVDAFSSDAIPIHLITREAIELYVRRLAPDGVLLFHVSNRFFRLRPVLAAVAPVVGFTAYGDADLELTSEQTQAIKYASDWVMFARTPDAAARDARWQPLERSALRVWTDDYSNPLGSMGLDIPSSRGR